MKPLVRHLVLGQLAILGRVERHHLGDEGRVAVIVGLVLGCRLGGFVCRRLRGGLAYQGCEAASHEQASLQLSHG
jgi:hypothetical protein